MYQYKRTLNTKADTILPMMMVAAMMLTKSDICAAQAHSQHPPDLKCLVGKPVSSIGIQCNIKKTTKGKLERRLILENQRYLCLVVNLCSI